MKQGICMRLRCVDCAKWVDIPKDKVDDYCIYHVLSDNDIRKTMTPKLICPDCLEKARKIREEKEKQDSYAASAA